MYSDFTEASDEPRTEGLSVSVNTGAVDELSFRRVARRSARERPAYRAPELASEREAAGVSLVGVRK